MKAVEKELKDAKEREKEVIFIYLFIYFYLICINFYTNISNYSK